MLEKTPNILFKKISKMFGSASEKNILQLETSLIMQMSGLHSFIFFI